MTQCKYKLLMFHKYIIFDMPCYLYCLLLAAHSKFKLQNSIYEIRNPISNLTNQIMNIKSCTRNLATPNRSK